MLAEVIGGQLLMASEVLHSYVKNDHAAATRWQKYWDRGGNAPDQEVLPVLWTAYEQATRPIVLDGYPRTATQLNVAVARFRLEQEHKAIRRLFSESVLSEV